MRRPRRMRRQAAAKRRACHRMAAQLKSQDAPRARTSTKVESKEDETEIRKSRTRMRSSPSMRMRMRVRRAHLRRAAQVKSEEGPATCPSAAQVKSEEGPATCPSQMSWNHNKAELIELIKVRIQQIEEEVEAKRMFEEFKKCIMKEMKFAAPGQAGSGETFSGLKEERIALEEALESYMPYARLRIEDVQSLKSNDLATSCDQPPVAPPVDKEKNKVEKIEQKQEKEDTNGKVIGGSPFTTHEPWQEFNLNQKSDLFGQSTRDYQYQPMPPIVAIRSTQADTFKQSQLGTEVLVNVNRIMAEVESGPKEGTQTASNTGSNLDNARQMHGMSPPIYQPSTASTPQSKSSNLFNNPHQSTPSQSPFESNKYPPRYDIPSAPGPPLGMTSGTWMNLASECRGLLTQEPHRIQIEVRKESEKDSFPMTVSLEPWLKAMNMSGRQKEDCLRVVFTDHSVVWSRQTLKTQIEQFNRLQELSESKSLANGGQQDELQFISEKTMRRYEKQMVTSPSETSSVIPSRNGISGIPKPETELKTLLPTDKRTLKQMGQGYIQPMLKLMRKLNPSMNLKIGANVFTCPQKAQDNLCYALSTVTGLMSMDSIRHAAALSDGYVGDALTKFTKSSTDKEKYQIVQGLAEEMSNQTETTPQEGEDASVFAQYLLDRLSSEGIASHDIFSQHVEAWSNCLNCGGERKSDVRVSMSEKNDQTPAAEGLKCSMEENCRDGEYYQITDLLNCPDSVIKVVGSRKNLGTYKQSEEVPYSMKGRGGAEYQLKFATIHLGDTPKSGHFVTAISNPGDRGDCVLIDNGKVFKIKRAEFDKFRKSAFFVGYELLDAKTIPKASKETIAKAMREVDAGEKLAALKRVSEAMVSCKTMIDKSCYEKEKKNALKDIIEKNLCTDGAGPLLREEEEVNSLAKRLVDEIESYERKPLSFSRKVKFGLGLAEDNTSFQRVERLAKSKVFGTGLRLLDHASKCQSQNGDQELVCANCKKTDIGILFECDHCLTIRCKTDMTSHIGKSRCTPNREINPRGFLQTPRKHATGDWGNENMRLSVIRPRTSGNKTQYILEENGKDSMSMVIRTQSTKQFVAQFPGQEGRQTRDGKMWLGEGYSKDPQIPKSGSRTRFVGAIEEVKYKDIKGGQEPDNFPIWSLHTKHFSVKETPAETGAVNMNLDGHPAKNPDNLQVEEELEFIQVAMDSGKAMKMVVRRPGKQDEELSFIKPIQRNEENPEVDEDIFQKMDNNQVNVKHRMTTHHIPFEQFNKEVSNPNVPYKFINGGRNTCWWNTSTQLVFSALPDIAQDLSAVVNQDSTLSGNRDLPKLLLETIANSSQQQCLENVRDLVMPNNQGKQGPALVSFEETINMLHQQAPESVKAFSSEKLLSHSREPCPTKTCNGYFLPHDRTIEKQIHIFDHKERLDGLSAQKCIDRHAVDEGILRSCTNGHAHKMTADVTFPKLPKTFLMTAYDGTLEQDSSMEVKFQGKTYRASAFIKHSRDHHWFAGEFGGKWLRVDDFGYGEQWKAQYVNSPREKAFIAGTEKLFDKLGVVCYKLKETESNQETMENDNDNRGDTRSNLHTLLKSGQQVFRAKNIGRYDEDEGKGSGNECYAIQGLGFLLSNPHMHNLLRTLPTTNATQLERYVQKLCHTSPDFTDTNIQKARQLVRQLSAFRKGDQQDAMEFVQAILQDIHMKDGVLGYTNVNTTTCTAAGCKRDNEGRSNEYVYQVNITEDSVNACLRRQLAPEVFPVDGKCDTCMTPDAIYHKTNTVEDLNDCVILHMNRFELDAKINRPVTVDTVLREGSFNGYVLTSAVLHHGETRNSGHYTGISHDPVNGTWVETDDHMATVLEEDVAKEKLRQDGYMLFYSNPDTFPQPLKAERNNLETLDQPTRGPTQDKSRRGTKRKRTSILQRAKTSMFRIFEGQPDKKTKLPEMPAQSNFMQSVVRTPTRKEIAARIKAKPGSKKQWTSDPKDYLTVKLKQIFGHDSFKSSEQMEATKEILRGERDTFVVMPTGHGKSATYQLPAALLQEKLTIVVSPLISLATDQVNALIKNGIEARLLSAEVFPIKNQKKLLHNNITVKRSYLSWMR